MAYSTVEEVTGMLREDTMSNLIGDEYIEDPAEREEALRPLAAGAIGDADAEIDGYLAKRYKVPVSPTPKVLNKFSKDIAVYNLMSRIGIKEDDAEKTILNRYNAAVKFLTQVASGLISLGVEGKGTEGAAATGFAMRSGRRLFSRESMRGM